MPIHCSRQAGYMSSTHSVEWHTCHTRTGFSRLSRLDGIAARVLVNWDFAGATWKRPMQFSHVVVSFSGNIYELIILENTVATQSRNL